MSCLALCGGKTTLALHAMAEMQKLGGTVALIDAEHAFDPEYSARLGLCVDDLVVCQPETGEMALEAGRPEHSHSNSSSAERKPPL